MSSSIEGVQLAKLVAPQRSANSLFGSSLAISGNTLVVGAHLHANGKGIVYIFQRDPTNPNRWLPAGQLLASDGADGDYFGVSVALYGSTMVVGAEAAKTPHVQSGAVYVFERDPSSANQWRQFAKLVASDTREQLSFGHDVAIDGDTLVVTALWDSRGTSSTYVFERNRNGDPNWRETAKPSTIAGKSVAIQGDTLVVGHPDDWSGQGAVFVFGRNQSGANTWGQVTKLVGSDTRWSDEFGYDVALEGDILAISAYRKESLGSVVGRGGAYIFLRSASSNPWQQVAMLQASDSAYRDSFGSSIAIKNRTVLVGARNVSNILGGEGGKGASYVFTPKADDLSSWQEIAKLTASDAAYNDYLGFAVATDGQTLIAAATGDDSRSGAAYVYRIYPRPQALDDAVTTSEDRAITIDVLANDSTDPSTGNLRRDSVSVVSAPSSGTAQVLAATGTITYTPKLNFFGTDSFTYSVESTVGSRATATVKITVAAVNDAPVFVSKPPLSVVERTRYTYSITVQDIDPGDRLTISAPISRPWLTLSQTGNQTALLSGTPPYTEIGQHTIQLKVQDAGGLSTTQTFTLTVEPNRLGPPSNMKAVPRSATELGLEWRDGSNGEVGFNIERRSSDGSWQQIATVGPNATSYIDTALTCGNTYEYRVRAYNEYSSSEYSNVASGTPNMLVTRSFGYSGNPVTIFDYRTAEASIVVGDTGMIADLDVAIEIEHIYDGDLHLSLVTPDGSTIALAANGEFQHHYAGTVFDDEAGSAIGGATAPFTGRFRPQQPLSTLDTSALAGTWKLVVDNHDGPFRGTIKHFMLRFAIPVGCAAPVGSSAQPGTSDLAATTPARDPADIEATASAPFSEISAGEAHVCALRSDGVLGCWGYSPSGETNVPSGTYRSVDAGSQYTCAVRADNTLGCWGNSNSQKTSPPSGTFTKVSAGYYHACAIRTDQTVACWGYSGAGSTTPPTGLFKEISAGGGHTCGIRIDNTLSCSGVNWRGEATPPQGTFTKVSAGEDHTCAVRSDSVLVCWGDSGYGQTTIPPGTYTDVAAGLGHTCALRTSGTLVCWGEKSAGQAAPSGTFIQISAEYNKTCAISTDTTAPLRCWSGHLIAVAPASPIAGTVNAGYSQRFSAVQGAAPYTFTVSRGVLPPGLTLSQDGLLSGVPTSVGPYNFFVKVQDQNGLSGEYPYTLNINDNPSSPTPSPNPPPVDPPLSAAPQTISAGGSFSCGVRAGGLLACWGRNDFNEATPPSGTFVQVAAGGDHGCALETSRHVRCWGSGRGHNGSYGDQNVSPYGTFSQVSAGYYHNCAVQNDSAVLCWGDNTWGQTNSPPDKGFVQVSAGEDYSCGLRNNGTVVCWGANGYGQTFVPSNIFTQISSHGTTSCGLRTDRTLVCWGDNRWGQATPLSGEFQAVSVGGRFACGLRIDGTIGCWGNSSYYLTEPPSGTFVHVSAGAEHACALRADGGVVCWGRSDTGAATPPAHTFATNPAGISAPLPRVTTINTLHDTGDGRLDEDELVEGHILHFIVTFNDALTYFRTGAYLLVAEGATPGFQTTSCARIDPQDQRILLSVTYQLSARTATIQPRVPAPGSLPSGTYRLFVCDTVTGSYPLLDGDNNAIAGGSFVRNFSVMRPPMTPRSFIPVTSR